MRTLYLISIIIYRRQQKKKFFSRNSVTSNLFVPQQSNDNTITITWLKGTTVAEADYVKSLPPIKTLSSIVHLVFYLMPLHVISTVLLLQPVPVVQLPSVPSTT